MRVSREEFNELVNKQRAALKSTARCIEKEALREKLDKDVAEFLQMGGKIEEIPAPGPVPRQPCKNPEPYPRREKPTPYTNTRYNKMLREWCDAVKGRAKRLAIETGYSEAWYSQRCLGRHLLRFVDFEHIEPYMELIETQELNEKKTSQQKGERQGEK